MTKMVLRFLVLSLVAVSLAGCGASSGGGNGAGLVAIETLTTDDMAGIEASLVADRVDQGLALAVDPSILGSVLADDVNAESTFQRRGRGYKGRRQGQGWQIRRADGTCPVGVEPMGNGWRVNVGSETCSVERLADGSLKIVRANGSEILVGPVPADGGTTTITVGDITWQAVFGTGDAALVTLTNTRSGRVLTVTESETGELTVFPSGGTPLRGRWNADGEVNCADGGTGRQYRYCGGR